MNPFGKPFHILVLFRKGLLRLHLFNGTKKALFLGKDNKLYTACLEANSGTGENQAKLNEIFHNKQAWQLTDLTGTRKPDAAAVIVTGTQQEAPEGKDDFLVGAAVYCSYVKHCPTICPSCFTYHIISYQYTAVACNCQAENMTLYCRQFLT